MVKRKDVLKQISRYAKQTGAPLRVVEGSNHTRIWVGDKYTTLPRHNDIPDMFAKKILKQVGIDK